MVVFGLLLAAALLALLHAWSGFDIPRIAVTIRNIDAVSIVLALSGMAVSVWLGAEKWRIALSAAIGVGRPSPPRSFLFHHTAVATVLGQILGPYIAGPLVRGAAARRIHGLGFAGGAASSVLEQAFDVGCTIFYAIAAAALFMAGVDAVSALFAMATLTILLAPALRATLRHAGWVTAIFRRIGAAPIGPVAAFGAALARAAEGGVLEPATGSKLFFLSALRFWAYGVIAIAAARLFPVETDVAEILFACAIVQITRLAAVTPGNLGFAEWGWALTLSAFGWPAGDAAAFAIILRMIGFAAAPTVLAASALVGVASPRSDA